MDTNQNLQINTNKLPVFNLKTPRLAGNIRKVSISEIKMRNKNLRP